MSNPQNPDIQEKQVVVFELNKQIYGVDINNVLEIIRPQTITGIPGSPDYVEGIINLRGQIIPVIDLTKRFHLQTNLNLSDRIIIVAEVENIRLGMIVDRVSSVQKFDAALIQPPPLLIEGINTQYLMGTVLVGDQQLMLLSLNFIFQEQEKEYLASVKRSICTKPI